MCVCELHQNAKLLLTAIPSQMDYKSLLGKTRMQYRKSGFACCIGAVLVQVQIRLGIF